MLRKLFRDEIKIMLKKNNQGPNHRHPTLLHLHSQEKTETNNLFRNIGSYEDYYPTIRSCRGSI
jgi:hypothetical protein